MLAQSIKKYSFGIILNLNEMRGGGRDEDPVLANFGSRALYPERYEMFKILLNTNSR